MDASSSRQLLDRLEIQKTGDPELDLYLKFSSFRASAKDRDDALKDIAGVVGWATAKDLNLKVAGGSAIPEQFAGSEYLKSLSIESKLLRWLAVTVLPKGAWEKVVADPAHDWPEAHMFYLMWAGFEDAVLAAIVEKLQEHSPDHISLHFDAILDRLSLHSTVSYSIVWWVQAAQASYSGEAQHHRQCMCATISNPTLDRLRLHSIVSYSIVWWIQAAQASYSGEA